MRIIILSAGTGSFYCGTCMRDNALAVALNKLGHDAMLLPLYLPLMLDEEASGKNEKQFYGGVNVYLQQISSFFRKSPLWIDKLIDSPKLLGYAAKRAGMTSPNDLGPLTISTLLGEEGRQIKELKKLTDWLETQQKPDVVIISNALLIGLAREIKAKTGAKIFCTLQGEDTFLDSLPDPHRTQAWQTLSVRAGEVDGLLPVSNYYSDLMIDRAQLVPDKVRVVHNGILLSGYPNERRTFSTTRPTIGFLARLCGPKKPDLLLEAFLLLRKRGTIPNLQLSLAGSMTESDKPFVDKLKKRIAEAGEVANVSLLPNISRAEKISFLSQLSVLSVPVTYGEAFGLYTIEALAAGTPVVLPKSGAFQELVTATGGGLLCEPGSIDSLADGLEEMLRDPVRAQSMGEHGRGIVRQQFSSDSMATNTLNAIYDLAPSLKVHTV